jgi:hypothetical protein
MGKIKSGLQKRLRRIDRKKDEFGALTLFDHILLSLVGLFIPLIMMLLGWIG